MAPTMDIVDQANLEGGRTRHYPGLVEVKQEPMSIEEVLGCTNE